MSLNMFPYVRRGTYTEHQPAWKFGPNDKTSVDNMVAAGFYFLPSSRNNDAVICSYCDIKLTGWTATSDPFFIHLEKSPDCCWALCECLSRLSIEQVKMIDKNLLDLFCPARLNARYSTFNKYWPHSDKKGRKCNIEQLVKAGLYFTPSVEETDGVTCISCQNVLSEWQDSDKPLNSHAQADPECQYLRLLPKKLPQLESLDSTCTKNDSLFANADASHTEICDQDISVSSVESNQDTSFHKRSRRIQSKNVQAQLTKMMQRSKKIEAKLRSLGVDCYTNESEDKEESELASTDQSDRRVHFSDSEEIRIISPQVLLPEVEFESELESESKPLPEKVYPSRQSTVYKRKSRKSYASDHDNTSDDDDSAELWRPDPLKKPKKASLADRREKGVRSTRKRTRNLEAKAVQKSAMKPMSSEAPQNNKRTANLEPDPETSHMMDSHVSNSPTELTNKLEIELINKQSLEFSAKSLTEASRNGSSNSHETMIGLSNATASESSPKVSPGLSSDSKLPSKELSESLPTPHIEDHDLVTIIRSSPSPVTLSTQTPEPPVPAWDAPSMYTLPQLTSEEKSMKLRDFIRKLAQDQIQKVKAMKTLVIAGLDDLIGDLNKMDDSSR